MEQRWGGYDIVCLNDEQEFEFLNGLWTGKKNPLIKAKVIRNTNFTNSGEIDWSDIAELDVEERQLASRQLQTGDIIIERSGGGPKQPVGRVVFFQQPADNSPYSFSNFTSAIRVKNKAKIKSLFLHYYLLYYYFNEDVKQHQSNTTGLRNLNFTGYKNDILIPLLTPSEQDKIIYILSSLQKAIKKQEKIINTTTALKKSLINKLFTEGTKGEPIKQTEIGMIPESWEVVSISSVTQKTELRDPSKKTPLQTFKYVDVSSVSNQLFSITTWSELLGKDAPSRARKVIRKGDVIFATVRPTLKRIALIPDNLDNEICSTGYCVLQPNEKIVSEFLYFFLQTQYIQSVVESLQKGASYPAITDTNLKDCLLPLPLQDEQIVIANSLMTFQKKENIARRKQQIYSSLFNTLLNELMTGIIRVNDLDFHSMASSLKTVTA